MKNVVKITTAAVCLFSALLMVPSTSSASDVYRYPGMMCKSQDSAKYERANYDGGRYYNNYNGTTNTVCPVIRKGYIDPPNGVSNAFYLQGYNGTGTTKCRVEARNYDGGSLFASAWKTKTGSGVINFYWNASELTSVSQYDHMYIYCQAGKYAKIYQYSLFW